MPSSLRPIGEVLDTLRKRKDCYFLPATHLPELPVGLQLPGDLREFYSRYSSARLFGDRSDPRYQILSPEEFVQIGIAISRDHSPVPLQQSWYALAHVQDGNYLAIDCHPDRLGYCYDAFHETFESLDYCRVIAHSFTELMNRAAEAGDEAWWLGSRYPMYGYADQFLMRG